MTNQPMHDLEITNSNQQGIKHLQRVIKLSHNHFSIILIHCNYEFLQQKVTQQIQSCCKFDILQIWLEQTTVTLHTDIQNQIKKQSVQAAIVFGLDQVDDLDQVLSSSNYIREEFRNSFPFPILLWVTDPVLQKWIQLAPDLESWTTTFRFKASTDELIYILQNNTDHIYRKVLEFGAHGFVPHPLVLGSRLNSEVEFAYQDLSNRRVPISSELEARLKFVLGLEAYSHCKMEEARTYFEQSLEFWQNNQRLRHQGCVLYYIGLWWRKSAALKKFEDGKYDQACMQAEDHFRQCIQTLEKAQRPDLVAKFVNALGEILRLQKNWSELEKIAQKGIQLHQAYPDPVRLAFAYGLFAEIKTKAKQPNWAEVKQIAGQALTILDQFESSLSPDALDAEVAFVNERQNHRGWYSLILAIALKQLGEIKEAIGCLERTQKNGSQLSSHLHIKILEALREFYFYGKYYQKAFQIKRKQYSIEQQYGLRAFVGAGYLQPFKSRDWPLLNSLEMPAQSSILASEIEASGRHRDVELLAQKIRSPRYKLLTIYGPSGVGKSSLINAGLIPELEYQQSIRGKQILSPIPVLRKYNKKRWLEDLGNLLRRAFEKQSNIVPPSKLNSPEGILEALSVLHKQNFVTILIFDQFEDFFFTSNDRTKRETLYRFLNECLMIPSVKVVLSIREDCLHYLLECNRTVSLKAIGSDILSQDFLYFLGNLSIENAKSLIQALVSRAQVKPDPDLIEALVADLASELGEVRPIELQLVGAQLEEEKMTASRYKKSGADARERIKKLIQAWLNRVIKECGIEHEDTAWKVLYQLTHREKIRTIKTQNELIAVSSEKQNRLRERQIKNILEVLEGSGVVSKLRDDLKNYYQLVHDYLVPYIQDEYVRLFDEVGQTVKKLKQQILQDDLILRLDAIIQMGKIATPQVLKPLKQLLDKGDSEVSLRWHIFKALAQIKDDEVIELLIRRGLEDPEPVIQAHAAHLIGQLQPKLNQFQSKFAIEKLQEKCKDEHRCVRMQARWAVKQFNSEPPEFEEKANPLLAYILIKGVAISSDHDDHDRINHLKSLKLRDTCGVVECGITYGKYDILVKVLAENIESLNELVMGMMPHLNWAQLTRTFVVVSEPRLYYWRRPPRIRTRKHISYVWIETSGLNSDSLIASLMDIPEVTEAATVYGGFDVIAKIEAEELTLRDIVLTQRIARLPFVDSTATYPVIMNHDNFYWDNSEGFRLPNEWVIE